MPDVAALDQHRYVSRATLRRSGVEVKTAVWFAARAGKLYVFSARESGKVKRLRNSARARIAPCDMRGKLRGPWSDAAARVVTEPALIERAHAALRAKYGWQMALTDVLSGLTGRARRRAWIEIDLAR